MNKLHNYGKKIYSQNNEDGILLQLLKILENKNININKYFFEFGVEDGSECITRILRDKGWDGVLLDGGYENKSINLFKEYITSNNIHNLIKKYKIKKDLGLLVIDIDYNDAYVALNVLEKLNPSIVVAEYNVRLGFDNKTVIHDPNYYWDYSTYTGCSAQCIVNIYKHYDVVYANGVNMFLLRKDISKTINYKTKPLKHFMKSIGTRKLPRFKYDYYKRSYVDSKHVNHIFIDKTTKISNLIKSYNNKYQTHINKLKYYRKISNYKLYESYMKIIASCFYNDINKEVKKLKICKDVVITLIYNNISILTKSKPKPKSKPKSKPKQ